MNLFQRLMRKASGKRCNHSQNYNKHKWNTPRGIPMIWFKCLDCDFSDRGAVAGNPWTIDEAVVITVRNGRNVE